ncbi:unnamed protein product [Boreogadus saida]
MLGVCYIRVLYLSATPGWCICLLHPGGVAVCYTGWCICLLHRVVYLSATPGSAPAFQPVAVADLFIRRGLLFGSLGRGWCSPVCFNRTWSLDPLPKASLHPSDQVSNPPSTQDLVSRPPTQPSLHPGPGPGLWTPYPALPPPRTRSLDPLPSPPSTQDQVSNPPSTQDLVSSPPSTQDQVSRPPTQPSLHPGPGPGLWTPYPALPPSTQDQVSGPPTQPSLHPGPGEMSEERNPRSLSPATDEALSEYTRSSGAFWGFTPRGFIT